ncbi:Peroxygenase 2 [Heracleum sosnowskyi]|uniref:Peroxygenase 2 n=1 Tax=Heracleum sosnowskyi TaxID=360622 RepID=A0AAD8I5W9_9APIA|nr:Peroxygenase 2 [Heracleum sosnowskyi]
MKTDDSMATEAHMDPVTTQRKIRNNLEDSLSKPSRALVAADTDHPTGTVGSKNHGKSVLQQHVSYFDKNNDGIVYPWETYAGFRAFGLNVIVSAILAFAFNLANSYPTLPGWIPSLLLPVHIDNIHKAKHGSDTGVFDTEGRFMPVNLENMFNKYAKTDPEKMTYGELWNMTEGNRVAYDFVGWIESKGSWTIFYIIAKDKDGFVSKDNVRSLFDGSLFEKLAKNYQTGVVKKVDDRQQMLAK